MVWNNDDNNQTRVYLAFEDNHLGQELANHIRHYGYKARVMNNLSVFKNVCKTSVPHVVVLEMKLLHDNSYYSIINEIQDETDSVIHTIFIAENGLLKSRLQAVREGAQSYLQKPVNVMSLLNQLNQLCHAEHQRQDKVLLISDGTCQLQHNAEALNNLGLSVSIINENQQILDDLLRESPDLLLINGDMPNVGAIELVQIIRQDEMFFGLPIAVLTKRDKRIFDEQAINAGIDSLIGLPIPEKDLAAICKTRIQRARNLKREYKYLAKRDALTGLYNKEYFYEKLNQAISIPSNANSNGAIIYISLEEFMGAKSKEADRVFNVSIGNILRQKVTPPSIAAHIDDHTFAILSYSTDERELDSQVEIIMQAIEKVEFDVDGNMLEAKYNVGVSLIGSQVGNAVNALKRAQQSCSVAFEGSEAVAGNEGDNIKRISPEIITQWTDDIKKALLEDRFRLVYQPIANLSGHPESFYEVFLRMQDEFGIDILPQEFLAVAEHAKISNKIDRWVIDQAVHVIAEQSHLGHKPILFIKIFPSSLDDKDLMFYIEQRLSESGVGGERFVFQITQSAANLRLQEAWELATGLKKLGCQIVVEHYGRDPDANHIIEKLPIDYIKIDGSLVVDINTNTGNQKKIEDIAKLASANNAMCIASLVQDASSLAILYRCGVDYIQGYFMQEPSDVFSSTEQLNH